MRSDPTVRGALIVVAVAAVIGLLYAGRSLWIPLSIGGLIAMLVAPIHHFLGRRGWPRWASITTATLAVVVVFTGFVVAIGRQAAEFADQWPEISSNVDDKFEQLEQSFPAIVPDGLLGGGSAGGGGEPGSASNGGSEGGSDGSDAKGEGRSQGSGGSDPQTADASGSSSSGGSSGSSGSSSLSKAATSMGGGLWSSLSKALSLTASALGMLLLTFVFTVLFLTQERRLEQFVLSTVVDDGKKTEGRDALQEISEVAQKYLRGRMILVVFLFVLYGIGFSIPGMQYALFAAFMASVLSIVPYVGNIIGGVLAVALALVSGGTGPIIGVVITMSVGQLLENYVLTPVIVGDEVSLNPLVTIVAVVGFGLLWGAVGAVVAIPLVAMLRVVCDHVPELEELSLLLGDDPPEAREASL